jgi:hypothetical protein
VSVPPIQETLRFPPPPCALEPCAPTSINQHTLDRPIPFADYLETQNRQRPALRQGDYYARLNQQRFRIQPPTPAREPIPAPSPGTPRIGEVLPTEPHRIQRTLEVTYHTSHPIHPGSRIDLTL